MAYYKSPFERIVEEIFSGPNRKINIVTLISVINAFIIFVILFHLEIENEGLLTIFGFFMVWRTLLLSAVSFHFRANIKRDFAKFLCIVNLLLALSVDYLIYNGDVTDSGWEVIDNLKNEILENLPDSSNSNNVPKGELKIPNNSDAIRVQREIQATERIINSSPNNYNANRVIANQQRFSNQVNNSGKVIAPNANQKQPEANSQEQIKLRQGFSIGGE